VLHQHGDVFGWRRDVDLDPSGPHPDEGVMRWDGEMLIETGVHENYVEHWVREDRPTVPAGAQFVTAADGTAGLLVWVGDTFGWAGGGEVGIDTGGGRWNALAAGSAGDQLDVDGMSWHIERTEGTAYP
jgi:hypothetical protein